MQEDGDSRRDLARRPVARLTSHSRRPQRQDRQLAAKHTRAGTGEMAAREHDERVQGRSLAFRIPAFAATTTERLLLVIASPACWVLMAGG